ncbi:MAG: hypothetical protein SNJ84_08160 [Verrucomicrobiia bacterium]
MPDLELFPKPFAPGFFGWSRYVPEIKTECHSTAVQDGKFLILIDPLEIPTGDCQSLKQLGEPAAILITNGNHARGALVLKKRLSIPVGAAAEAVKELGFIPDFILNDMPRFHGLEPKLLPGAGAGETAFYHPKSQTLIFGDAAVHLKSAHPEPLPDQYCSDPAQLKTSLQSLRHLPVKALFFAHGEPILKGAAAALKKLTA